MVLENFARDSTVDDAQRNMLLGLGRWIEAWGTVDSFGVHHMEAGLFVEMMCAAPLPLGFGSFERSPLWMLRRLQRFRIPLVRRPCHNNNTYVRARTHTSYIPLLLLHQ